jgi:uncharacterized protein YjbI with pentapeptide repeats
VVGADLSNTGLTKDQLYSTRSYRAKDLHDVELNGINMAGWDFSGHNLAGASLVLATLKDAKLTGADVTGTDFALTTSMGLTKEQFYSTANYKSRQLQDISLRGNDVSNWDFRGHNLTGASFSNATLENTDLTNAVIANATFENTTSSGFTKDQLYATASYKNRDLRGIRLQANSLRNWDLSEQNLTNADFFLSTLRNVNFSDSNLAGAIIVPTVGTNLSGANLKNATLQGDELPKAIVDGNTVYNQWTVFPDKYDPVAAGLRFEVSPTGDFDAGGDLDVTDVELLEEKIRGIHRSKSYSSDRMFDVNSDGRVDDGDLRFWVKDVRRTWFGDANLDGVFDSSDLIQVFQAAGFEGNVSGKGAWSTGDWNADGDVTTSDLIVAFQDGGYEQGPLAGAQSVPEPSAAMLAVVAVVVAVAAARRRSGRSS